MSNNYWQTQNNQNGAGGQEPPVRKSGLLSSYTNRPAGPSNGVPPQGPPPISPFPGASNQGNQPPQQQPRWNGPGFMARPVEMVRRWSAKMTALRQHEQAPVDPQPLVRYRGNQPMPTQAPGERPRFTRPTPWRRSRVQRITHLRKKRLERWQRSGPDSKRLRTLIFATIAGLLLVLLTSTGTYAYGFYTSELPQLQSLANLQNIPQSTHIYDRHGVLLDTLYQNTRPGTGGRGTLVSYQYLPIVMQDAQIAAEDPTFWSNDGIDPQGMLRALTQYVSNNDQVVSGGSTITQQLIKNLSHQAQDTLQRKANEAALAIGLTQQYPKWKILEMYFNVTPYGAQDQGVDAAVEDYFGLKPVCDVHHRCTPAVAFLDRDLTKCKNPADETTCASDPLLALTRAAMLAGIPQNPTLNDPTVSDKTYQHMLSIRLPYVLHQMQANGYDIEMGLGDPTRNAIDKGPITDDIIAKVEKMAANMNIVGFHQPQTAPHFVQWVIKTLANSLGNYQDLDLNGISIPGYQILLAGGFNIYTTLDLNLEQFVEKDTQHYINDKVCQPYTGCSVLSGRTYNLHDSATIVMDAKTGEVLAMNGSTDYNDSNPLVAGQVNVAVSPRQPGSSMKPIVYAAAFEKGWYPGMRVFDQKTYFPTNYPGNVPVSSTRAPVYQPTDYGNRYHNVNETVRINLANSFNIPAIKALMFAGFDSVVDMARRMGITDIDSDLANFNAAQTRENPNFRANTLGQYFGPSIAIGSAEISDLQMVGAYQVFADNGTRVPYHNILDIYDNYGHDLYHYDPAHPNGVQVISPQIAYLVNAMLDDDKSRDKYEFAGIHTLTMSDWDNQTVAAKTGTTNGPKDNWTIGYTTSLVVGVWSGNANGMNMGSIIGVSGAGPIWHDVIEYATGRSLLGMTPDIAYPANAFPQPDGVVYAPVNNLNGLQGNGTPDWMLVNEQPQQSGMPTCDTTQNPFPDPTNPNPACQPGGGNGNGFDSMFGGGDTTTSGETPTGDGA